MEYMTDAYKQRVERRLALLNDMKSGVSVYAVYASYRKEEPDHPYYVMARSRREANIRFNRNFGWLKIFRCARMDYHKAVQVVLDVGNNIII